MAAQPTPTTKVQWDGTRGHALMSCLWDGSHTLDIQDSSLVDVSSLSPRPPGDRLKICYLTLLITGAPSISVEFSTIAAGVVDTGVAGNDVAWVSGDKFATTWFSEGPGNIGIDGSEYPITSVTDTENMVCDTPPHNGAAFDYTVDQLVSRVSGSATYSREFLNDFRFGPSEGINVESESASLVGDIVVTSSGASSGDALSLYVVFKKT